MASRKITELTALTTPASNDVLPIIDVSETSAADQNKKITIPNLTSQLSAASTSAAGIVQLNDTISSTSTTQAATANAVKTAYDLANAAIPSSGRFAARAWVNFNGTGTVAIRASGNVTSITDNGVGDYTLNFTNALADANYSVVGAATRPSGGGSGTFAILASSYGGSPTLLSTTAVRVCTGGGTDNDMGTVCVAIFR